MAESSYLYNSRAVSNLRYAAALMAQPQIEHGQFAARNERLRHSAQPTLLFPTIIIIFRFLTAYLDRHCFLCTLVTFGNHTTVSILDVNRNA